MQLELLLITGADRLVVAVNQHAELIVAVQAYGLLTAEGLYLTPDTANGIQQHSVLHIEVDREQYGKTQQQEAHIVDQLLETIGLDLLGIVPDIEHIGPKALQLGRDQIHLLHLMHYAALAPDLLGTLFIADQPDHLRQFRGQAGRQRTAEILPQVIGHYLLLAGIEQHQTLDAPLSRQAVDHPAHVAEVCAGL